MSMQLLRWLRSLQIVHYQSLGLYIIRPGIFQRMKWGMSIYFKKLTTFAPFFFLSELEAHWSFHLGPYSCFLYYVYRWFYVHVGLLGMVLNVVITYSSKNYSYIWMQCFQSVVSSAGCSAAFCTCSWATTKKDRCVVEPLNYKICPYGKGKFYGTRTKCLFWAFILSLYILILWLS